MPNPGQEHRLERRDLTIQESAYIAGFLDGEGCFLIGRRSGGKSDKEKGKTRYRAIVHVGQVDVRPLVWMKSLMGGSIFLEKRYLKDQSNRAVKSNQPFHCLTLQGTTLDRFLPQIIPFMIVKKDQAQLVLEMRKLISRNNRKNISPQEHELRIGLIEQARMKKVKTYAS